MRSRNSKKGILFKVGTTVPFVVLLLSASAFARPWNDHLTRLALLSKQIETKEEEIHKLISAKSQSHDHRQVAELIRTIADAHKDLVEVSREYEEERRHVRFEHPERNAKLERVYSRHQVKSLREMEVEFGLDGRLDRLKARVLATFPLPAQAPKAEETKRIYKRTPASASDEELPERIYLKR